MRTATFVAACVATVGISLSAAAAEQGVDGLVTGINRLNGTIAIQRIQSGTVGAAAGAATSGASEEFKIKDGAMVEEIHAGDRVTFSTADGAAAKTITKLERKK